MSTSTPPISLDEQIRRMTPVAAPPEQRREVAELSRFFGAASAPLQRASECKLVGPSGEEIVVPDTVFHVLARVAEVMARGDSVTIVPVGQQLTTQQAANLLNVSRQYLVRLLDEGRIPYTKTGKHRRLSIDDVLAFKARRDRERKHQLNKLTRLSENYGGYDELKQPARAMLSATFKVVLDANVLFPFTLRDTLLRAAAAGMFQLYWSEQILNETARNLVATGRTTETQAAHLRSAMENAFPEAMAEGHETLIAAMPNHEKDRHVVAAAVKVGAEVIVTQNLRDFRPLPDGIEAQHPDDFLCYIFDLGEESMLELLRQQAAALQNPPRTVDDLLRGLARVAPNFAGSIAQFGGMPNPLTKL